MVLSNTVDLCVLSLITTRVYATLFGAETRMAETLPKLTSSRAGYRAHLTKTLNRARDLMEKEEPTEMGIVSLNSITCTEEIYSTGTWRENRTTPWRTDEDEIQDEILELSSQRSRFIHLTLFDKKSTQPPSPATHQEFPQVVEQWISTRAK